MKLKSNQLCLALACSTAFLLFSCTKDQQANGVTYQLKSSAAPVTIDGSGAGNGALLWTSGYASVVEINFQAKSNSIEVEYKSEAKQKINLFSPLSTLGVIAIPPGSYNEVEYEVEVQPNGTDAAFFIDGNFTNGAGEVTPILFKVNRELEIESKQSNVTIADGASLTAVTTLNLSLMTTGVTEGMLNSATRTGGVIEISDTSNTDIYNIIYDNLRRCGGVEVD